MRPSRRRLLSAFCLLVSSLSCGPSGPGSLKPLAAPDPDTACPGGRGSWKLEVLDRRAERRATEKVTALVADSIRRSFPGCAWDRPAADAPSITVEIDAFSSSFNREGDNMWDAAATWSVLVREASGRTVTEFECDASASQPNYSNANNEKEVLNRVFDEALSRALAGLRAIPAQ
jgi:hypothetical protein